MPTPVIIEARVNETAWREGNAALPYSADEIVGQAHLALDAGASIIHWHGRDAVSGEPRNDVALYLDVAARLRASRDVVLHPTLGYITQEAPEQRLAHIEAGERQPGCWFDLAPVEFGSVNVDYWDPDKRRFSTGDRIYANRTANVERVLRALSRLRTRATAVVWDAGHIRTARCFVAMGLLPAHALWELVFTGETMPSGTPPTAVSLQALLEQLPDGAPWLVLCWNGDVLPIAERAIAAGGHVAIGLGDHPYRRLGQPHNGELVAAVAQIAQRHGRPVATPAQARDLLGLPGTPG